MAHITTTLLASSFFQGGTVPVLYRRTEAADYKIKLFLQSFLFKFFPSVTLQTKRRISLLPCVFFRKTIIGRKFRSRQYADMRDSLSVTFRAASDIQDGASFGSILFV
jgi:hypothetical protein